MMLGYIKFILFSYNSDNGVLLNKHVHLKLNNEMFRLLNIALRNI